MMCREVSEFIEEYLSGELSADQRHVFEQHLAACPDCVAYVKSYEEAVKLGKAAFNHPDEEVPTEVPADLVRAILSARHRGN